MSNHQEGKAVAESGARAQTVAVAKGAMPLVHHLAVVDNVLAGRDRARGRRHLAIVLGNGWQLRGAAELVDQYAGNVWDVPPVRDDAALCAEAVGAMKVLLDTTVEYTKQREQFGIPIGKFQVLRHRMADMMMEYEQAKSMALVASLRLEEDDPLERRKAVSGAKVQICQRRCSCTEVWA